MHVKLTRVERLCYCRAMDEIVVKQEVRRVIDLARIMQGVRARRLAREREEGITRVMEGESRFVGSGVVQEEVSRASADAWVVRELV